MANSSVPVHFPPGYLEEDNSGSLLAVDTIILVISTVLLVLRLYARSLTPAARGWDEFLLPPAWLLVVGLCAVGYLAINEGGAGRHVAYVVMTNPKTLVMRAKLLLAFSYLSAVSNAFSRISVVALYLRVFSTRASGSKITRIASWATLVYLIAFVFSQVISGFFECRPFSYIWEQFVPGTMGTCFNVFLFFQFSGVLNIVGDFAILLIPIPTIVGLQSSSAKKLGIIVVFASGSLGIVASCIRTNSLFAGKKASLTDPTWNDVPLYNWTIVESGMYLAAACLVGCGPVFQVLPAWFKKYTTTRNYHGISGRSGVATGRSGINMMRKSKNLDDQDSISNIQMIKPGETLTSFDRDVERFPADTTVGRDIRVNTEIQVTAERKGTRY